MTSIRAEIRRLTREAAARVTCPVTVESITPLTAHFRRVTVSAAALSACPGIRPTDAFKLMLPPRGREFTCPDSDEEGMPRWPDGQRPVLRAYTVRHVDADAGRLCFDVALHGGGLGTAWLAAARPGETAGLAGMRHEFHAVPGVDHHVLIADASGLPAAAAILELLRPHRRVSVFLETGDEADRDLVDGGHGAELTWRIGEPSHGSGSALAAAVREGLTTTEGRAQVWIAAEAGVVRELRRHALADLGVDRDDLHASAYWKAGQTSESRDEHILARYRQAIRDGLDVSDPDVISTIELS